MDVTETSYIKSNGIYSLPGVSHRRFIVIPVLFAIGQGKLKNTQSAKMNIMNIKTGHLLSFFGVVFSGTATTGTLFTTLGYAYTHGSYVYAADGYLKYGYHEDDAMIGVMISISYLCSDSNPKGGDLRRYI
ncbi:hypothetical protein AB4K26_18650 [Klebsiella variicola]|uniref:hypothetical protein n=1 Tax=Klebsiella variicola TaxID=244366 RepID=UPI0034C618FD